MAMTNEQLTKWIDEIFGTIDEIKVNSGDITNLSKTVKTQGETITALQDVVAAANAASHNAQYRGDDITTRSWCEADQDGYITADGLNALYTRIADGSFEDIFIGDYFKISMTSDYGTEDVTCVIADLDTFLNTGDTTLSDHHAVIIPDKIFNTLAPMNSTGTTGVSQNPDNPVGSSAEAGNRKGGYLGCDLRQLVLPKYATALATVFGTHLLSYRSVFDKATTLEVVSSGYTGWSGASSEIEWTTSILELLNENQVFGSNIFSSSGVNVGLNNTQLSYFRHNPSAKIKFTGSNRIHWWLRSVASGTSFSNASFRGYVLSATASDSSGVCPFWLIGKAPVTQTTQTRKTKKTLTKKED